METVIELDRQYGLNPEAKEAAEANEAWITALSAFNTTNSEVFDFVDRFGLENKTNFLLILTKRIISDALSPKAQVEFVRAIRLCFRETEGTKAVLTKDLVLKLVSLAHLDDLQFSAEDNPQHSILVNESLKVLVNLLISHRDTSRPLYLELDFPFKLMIALTGPSITGEMAFSVTRILRHLSIQDTETKKQLLENDLLSVLTTVLSKLEAEIRTDDGLRASKEIADLIYMITTHLGPLEGATPPNANELTNFQTLVKIFQNYLFLPIADEKFHTLKESTVKCLINVPAACTQLFDHMRTLSSLIEILQYEAFKAGDPAQNLTPILLILSSIARGIPQSREIIKNIVFPDNEGVESHDVAIVPEQYGREGTLSSKIIQQMTSSNYGLHYYACDFIYLICDEEMDEVVRLTGFGNAAGVIATHQVLSGLGGGKARGFKPQGETSDIAQHFVQPQEDIHSSSSSSSSSSSLEVSDEPAQAQGEPRREMSEEEAERLMGMIERMEKLGVIKVMRKSDGDQ